MSLSHKTLEEEALHECKGASSAPAGYVQKANGNGTASWVDPKSFIQGAKPILIFEAVSTIVNNQQRPDLNPSELFYKIVKFATPSTMLEDQIDVDSDGVFTLIKGGIYEVHCEMQAATFSGAPANSPVDVVGTISYTDGSSITRTLANQVSHFTTNSQVRSMNLLSTQPAPAGQKFFVSFGCTSSNVVAAQCGLWTRTYLLPWAASFGSIPGASIRIYKVG